ncbi:MAG TPA: ABC transporter substrate-binding protein [Thermoanaerobaculia bacterium]|nr:ABC transporter substrate-binding protein [Thermoanaerobaculia bacterium]
MTTRRAFIGALAGGVLAPLSAGAQQAAKVWRIGFLAGGARTPDGAPPAALRQALQALGYVEGKNVTYVGRWAEAKRERLPGLAAELVGLKVDLIVTRGGPAAEAARQATTTIPIVIAGAGDAVGTGLISSLAHPGGNITGITDQAAELSAKRLELLKEAVPKASRIAVLWNADDLAMTLRYREVERAARILRVTVQPLGVREPEDFDTAFAAMTRNRPDAFFLVTDALTILNRKRIIDFAAARRIPAMYEFDFLVRDGGLMSYGPDLDDNLRRAAVYVDKILKGAKPGDLPVEQPTRYYLLVNLKTAKALGLTIPQSLLLRADEVIQ